MSHSKLYLTSIEMDVYRTGRKNRQGLDRVKVYYDFLELSDRQIKSIIRMIRLFSRGNRDKR